MSLQVNTRRRTQRKPFNDILNDFKEGVVTLVDEARISKKAAKQATNLYQTQDGIWSTRPGTAYYGRVTPNAANIDGCAEYVKSDGTTELIVVATNVYKSTDGGAWTQITGATFTAGAQCFFIQIKAKLYISNGTDSLAYYDGTDLHTYTEIAAPAWAGTPLARTVLTAGSYNVYYQVTALNGVGETVANAEQTITVNKPRDLWETNGTEYITIDWSAVAGATRYQVYYSDESGYEVFLASTTDTTYNDDGLTQVNEFVETPDANTTGGPKFKQMELSADRIWGTGNPNDKYAVYFSGTGTSMGTFSEFYGGGTIYLDPGGRDIPVSVVHYRTGKGDSVVTVLCSSPEGQGSIWQVSLISATLGDTTFTIPSAIKIVGSIGTNAPLSVVKVKNDIAFFNKKGFTNLGSKAGLLNILATDELSVGIRPSVRSLVGSKISDICGYYYDGKIYWSVPESSSGNDKIYVFDTERRNWQIAWSFGVAQFMEYTETDGTSKLLGVPVSGTKLIQISDTITGDLGSAFSTQYISGLYSIDKDKTIAAKIKDAYIELGNPRGNISFSLLGSEKNKAFSQIGSITITGETSQTGYTLDKYTSIKYTTTSGTPTSFSASSIKKRIKINKLLYNYQYQVSSSGYADKYSILSLQVKGKIVPTRLPSSWDQ